MGRYQVSSCSFVRLPLAVAWLLCAALAVAEDTPPAGKFNYPDDLRAFREKALKTDGPFTPDIAFTIRRCPRCGSDYVYGHYPRLSRRPFDSLAQVHETIETVAIRNGPPPPTLSPVTGKEVPRACPVCREPEGGALADRALFCHRLPISGDDLQIEYEIRENKLAARRYFRIRPGGVEGFELVDEDEEAIKAKLGEHFSLRAVWNEMFAQHMKESKIVYRDVAPGLSFLFRPGAVSDEAFREFVQKDLKADRDKGKFSRLESPLQLPKDPQRPGVAITAGSYVEWAAPHVDALSQTRGECFVLLHRDRLREAAAATLAARDVKLEPDPTGSPYAAVLRQGAWKLEWSLGELMQRAVIEGLSLEHAASLDLDDPAFTLNNAQRLEAVLRERHPLCKVEARDGTWLVLRDMADQERKVELTRVARHLSASNDYMVGLFCARVLPWEEARGVFAPEPPARDIAPTGLPAFIERRVRPAGFLAALGKKDALFEPRLDSAGRRFDLCYTSECVVTSAYVDPSQPRFAGMTVDQARALYEGGRGLLPMTIEAEDALRFPGLAPGLVVCKVALVCGLDIASLGAEDARATALANAVGISDVTERVHIYAATTHTAAVSPRRLSKDELALVRGRLKSLAAERGVAPGTDLDLYFDLPRAAPKGKVIRR